MNLSAPTQPVFLVAIILAILAVVSTFVVIPVITANAFWAMVVAFAILAVGNLLKGM
jgi:hypothetical protein